MGSRNLAHRAMTRAELMAVPIGTPVVDGDMTIFIKQESAMWRSERGVVITTGTLEKHSPIKPWTGLVPR